MAIPSKNFKKILLVIFIIAGLFVLQPVLLKLLPEQEMIQSWFQEKGWLGWLAYFGFAVLSEFFIPLTFAIPGIAAGFVYGLWFGFFSNWITKMLGSIIAFYLGRYFGHKIIPLFGPKAEEQYQKLAESKVVLYTYFLFSFIPFTPGDTLTYFIGGTSISFRRFLFIRGLGSLGTTFVLAYLGTGNSLLNPLPILGMLALFLLLNLYFKKRQIFSF